MPIPPLPAGAPPPPPPAPPRISPSPRRRNRGDRVYRWILTALALCLPFLLVTVAGELVVSYFTALRGFRLPFLWQPNWVPFGVVDGGGPPLLGYLHFPSNFLPLP